jgi:hypothetical protein
MGESLTHIQLVQRIVSHVRSEFPDSCLCILLDLPESPRCDKPPVIEGYHPDLFAEDTPPTFTVIGEAKTASDLETVHSKLQFRAYLSFLRLRPRPRLVVATPWYAQNSARTLLAAAKREADAEQVEVAFVH